MSFLMRDQVCGAVLTACLPPSQIIDDLRPEAAYYNQSYMITPNIDRLGRGGLVLNRAFCQQAVGATLPRSECT